MSFLDKATPVSRSSFLDKATAVPSVSADSQSLADKIWSSISEPVGAAARTIENIPASTINFGKSLVDFFNPINTSKTIAQIPSAALALQNESQGLPEVATPSGIAQTTPASAIYAPDIGNAAYEATVPSFMRNLFSGNTEAAQKDIENDPVGQIAPLILLARGVSEKAGLVEQFDRGVSKVASPVTKTIPIITEAVTPKIKSIIEKNKITDTEAVGKILQGKRRDVRAGIDTLQAIDATGIETYKDLSQVLSERIKDLSRTVDERLSKNPTTKTTENLTTNTKVGNQSVSFNYIEAALDHLHELYQKTVAPGDAARIEQLVKKGNETGFSAKEVNDIAREYNTTFREKAFNSQTGEALTSVNAQAYENVRKGIKNVARDMMPDAGTKEIDKQITDTYNTKRLVDRMNERVNALEQRITKRGLIERIGRGLANIVDIATFGGIKAFTTRLFLQSNVGLKTMNSIDLQNALQKNLKIIQDAMGQSDTTLVNTIVKRAKEVLVTSASDVNNLRVPTIVRDYFEKPKIGLSVEDVNPTFKGFSDITSKVLDRLKGKSITSKQEILDFTNMPELKQPERDLIRRIVQDFPDRVPVQEFANKVKSELLPLKYTNPSPKYESIALSDELRGPVVSYQERIYQSPIKTSAGDVHFGRGIHSQADNYFAHTRIEDLPGTKTGRSNAGTWTEPDMSRTGTTRRVIELQSDLFQKGGLEGEVGFNEKYPSVKVGQRFNLPEKGEVNVIESNVGKNDYDSNSEFVRVRDKNGKKFYLNLRNEKTAKIVNEPRATELQKLEPYRNTWHERIIREEVKQAAKDGKTNLQFPTGETAMKIEGLGQNDRFFSEIDGVSTALTKDSQLKVGMTIGDGSQPWIITDVLGDGKFKAVPKSFTDKYKAEWSIFGDWATPVNQKRAFLDALPSAKEIFDISGKVDTENPIYKFYEKEVGKYLKNKYGAKIITDPQGVKWWEVRITPEMKKEPVGAFSMKKPQISSIA
jgi:hypothetical protein